jgi:hypothetical protein
MSRASFTRALAAALSCATLLGGLAIWAAGASAHHHPKPPNHGQPARRLDAVGK